MKPSLLKILSQLLLAFLPLFYFLYLYSSLPEQIPMHYNSLNEPNRMGTRKEMLLLLLSLAALSLGVSALLRNIHKIDPKQKYAENSALMNKFAWAMLGFMSLLGLCIVFQTQIFARNEKLLFIDRAILSIVALVFTMVGNLMNNLKPNYFVGIRTPWNLENEDNWKKTHHLAARLWFFGGLLMAIMALSLPQPLNLYSFIAGAVIIVLIPFTHSYLLYRKEKK